MKPNKVDIEWETYLSVCRDLIDTSSKKELKDFISENKKLVADAEALKKDTAGKLSGLRGLLKQAEKRMKSFNK